MRALSLATVFAAASGFIILTVASWALGVQRFGQFMAFWSLFFALAGVVDGLMQETTRAVAGARTDEGAPSRGARPFRVAGMVGIIVALVLVTAGPLWAPRLLVEDHGLAVVLLAVGLVSYTYQAVLSGVLSGCGLWAQYAWLMAVDSGVRLVLVLVAWPLGWGLPVFLVVTVLGAATWLVILGMSADARAALRSGADVRTGRFVRNAVSAMLATGATALLIVGFPTFVKAVAGDSVDAGLDTTVDGIMLAVMLTRAPILVPLQRFQSALIVHFVENSADLLGALRKPLSAVFGVGVLGAVAAWLLGPWIMGVFFSAGFVVPGPVLAALTFGAACTGVLMITGTATLAVNRHNRYVAGWVTGSMVAFGVFLAPFPLAMNVCLALVIGPVAGALVHVTGLRQGAAPLVR
ncbi:lipopolysaccharide biosynthesis protein [Corynebacterium sp. CCM 9203]|uniref:lipopolysaccharide biosynthesis protein n=1 Tax=Corynebacterium sp. CCM 9203 TaxID=3057615 RepID=UPI0035267938